MHLNHAYMIPWYESCSVTSIIHLFFRTIDTHPQARFWLFSSIMSEIAPAFNGTVCIVGAGAAGLTAGYTLKQRGIENIIILEASSTLGGRIRKVQDFASFPIDVGAEWIHVAPTILNKITGVPNTSSQIKTFRYDANPYQEWDQGEFVPYNLKVRDYKFVNYTWFDFFNDFIAPSIVNNIIFDSQVQMIDYTTDNGTAKVRIVTQSGNEFECDRVIVTVPLQILKDGDITFIPPLSSERLAALDVALMPPGLKVFLEFTETFYPINFGFAKYDNVKVGDHLYFDATLGQQDTDQHILGLFAMGEPTKDYLNHHTTHDDLRDYILNELDYMFDNKASETFVRLIVQNWTDEPFIRGSYSEYFDRTEIIRAVSLPIDNVVYFAGEAMPADGEWYGYVHGAALSGQKAANSIVKSAGRTLK
jgi:monoamine oxidase